MIFIHDTRDKKGKHENVERFIEGLGHKIVRSKMFVGDIARLNDQSVCIDLKASLTEVEGNLIQQHDRFRREAVRAQENGIRLIVLVEAGPKVKTLGDVARWENPRLKRWEELDNAHSKGKKLNIPISSRPPVSGSKLAQIMHTMSEKYGIEWRFCCHQDAGREILSILGVEVDEGSGAEDQADAADQGAGRKSWRSC